MKPSKEEKETKEKIQVTIDLNAEYYYKVRGYLYNKGLTFTDMVNYINKVIVYGNEDLNNILKEAVKYKLDSLENKTKDIAKELKINKTLIYKILKNASALNNKEGE